MRHANRLTLQEGIPTTIAGAHADKKVRCSAPVLPVFNDLVGLANRGNYWAGLIVRGIQGLTSGRLHMDNIYVQQEKDVIDGYSIFYVILPGVTATIESHTDGNYKLTTLKADTNYLKMQKGFQRPGLWRISESPSSRAIFQPDGNIKGDKYRPVVISGLTSVDPSSVGDKAKDDLQSVHPITKTMVKKEGFDLHFTPGNGHVIGLKPAHKVFNCTRDKYVVESATLLANTMYKARNIAGVLWFSDWDGSAILTRAL